MVVSVAVFLLFVCPSDCARGLPGTLHYSAVNIQDTTQLDQPATPSVHPMQTRSTSTAPHTSSDGTLRGNDIELILGTELTSCEENALSQFYDRFESKEFLIHQVEGLPSFITSNSY